MKIGKSTSENNFKTIKPNKKAEKSEKALENTDKVDIQKDSKPETPGFFDKVKNFYNERIKGSYDNLDYKTKSKIKGGAVGAAAGGVAGYIAGGLQESKEVVITRTYPVPVMDDKNLGEIPRDWYQNDWSGWDHGPDSHAHDYAPKGWRSIVEEGPRFDSEGKIVTVDKTETLSSSRYGRLPATLLGMTIGTVAGVLGSVAINLISGFDEY